MRLRCEVGLDVVWLEIKNLSPARRRAERVTFSVRGDGRELWSKKGVRAGDKPVPIDIDVSGVRVLQLSAETETAEGWLYGSVAWGGARIELGSAPAGE